MVSKECPLCGGTKEVIERPPRLMGATYPENDPYKGDEHLEPCPLCEQKQRSEAETLKGGRKEMWPDRLPITLTAEEAKKFEAWLEENAYEFNAGETARVDGKFYVLPKAKLEALLKAS